MSTGPYSIERTHDEEGNERWFVTDIDGNWVSEPRDTWELADDERKAIEAEA